MDTCVNLMKSLNKLFFFPLVLFWRKPLYCKEALFLQYCDIRWQYWTISIWISLKVWFWWEMSCWFKVKFRKASLFFADNLIFCYLRPLNSHFLSAYVCKYSSWPLYLLKNMRKRMIKMTLKMSHSCRGTESSSAYVCEPRYTSPLNPPVTPLSCAC